MSAVVWQQYQYTGSHDNSTKRNSLENELTDAKKYRATIARLVCIKGFDLINKRRHTYGKSAFCLIVAGGRCSACNLTANVGKPATIRL